VERMSITTHDGCGDCAALARRVIDQRASERRQFTCHLLQLSLNASAAAACISVLHQPSDCTALDDLRPSDAKLPRIYS